MRSFCTRSFQCTTLQASALLLRVTLYNAAFRARSSVACVPGPSAAMAAATAQLAPAEAPAVNCNGDAFRDYSLLQTPRQCAVAAFYAEQHAKQTHAFVQAQKVKHLGLTRREMSVWEAAGRQRRRQRRQPRRCGVLACVD